MKKETIQIRISKEMKEDISLASALWQWSMSQYITYAIKKQLKKDRIDEYEK